MTRSHRLELVAAVVGAYVAHNRLPVGELPALVIPSTRAFRPPLPRNMPSCSKPSRSRRWR